MDVYGVGANLRMSTIARRIAVRALLELEGVMYAGEIGRVQ